MITVINHHVKTEIEQVYEFLKKKKKMFRPHFTRNKLFCVRKMKFVFRTITIMTISPHILITVIRPQTFPIIPFILNASYFLW